MKTKSLLFLCFLLFSSLVYAAVPHLINYQGRLTDAQGQPLTGSYPVTFRIYDAESAGNLLWEEAHTGGMVIDRGLFSVLLGSVTNLNIPFDKPYFLEIVVSGEVLSPRQRITASAYAMRAEKADYLATPAQQGDILYFDGTAWSRLGAGTSGQFLKTNGSGANPAWANTTLTPTFSAGSIIFARSDSEYTQACCTGYEKIKEICVGASGTITVDFDMRDAGGASTTAYGRIYVNGMPVGTERTTASISYVTFSDNINVNAGDLVQLYGHSGNGTATFNSNYRNFRLKASQFFGGYVTFARGSSAGTEAP